MERKLLHQVSSGFGTQPNDSRDEPTITESIELRLMGQYNSTDTDPGDHHSIQRTDHQDEEYMQYQKALLTRSPSYRKSLDRLSLSSDTSQKSLIPSKSKSDDEDLHGIMESLSNKRTTSGQSLNTLSMEQEDLLNQVNLRDELLNCEHKELFQFLQEDAENSNSYGNYHNCEADTDSLLLDSKKEGSVLSPPRKASTSSLKSNLSYLSNSILQQLEQKQNSIAESIDKVFGRGENGSNSHRQDEEPLVGNSEFDNIIESFERELEEIKQSTTSLERRLESLSDPSPVDDDPNKVICSFLKDIESASITSGVQMRQNGSSSRSSIKLKRRSLEKQRKIDDDFNVANEIRKICDELQKPCMEIGTTSPFLRRKTDPFSTNFDIIKRRSFIERVDELPEDEHHKTCIRVESEKLPRRNLIAADVQVDSISLKSTTSYENILIQKQQKSLLLQQQQQDYQQQHDYAYFDMQHIIDERRHASPLKTNLTKAEELKPQKSVSIEHQQPIDDHHTSADNTVHTTEPEKSGTLQSTTKLAEKPWHCLVSYVDDLTVGGRRNSQGTYNDPMSFPGFGGKKPPKPPQDCFPQKCYEQ